MSEKYALVKAYYDIYDITGDTEQDIVKQFEAFGISLKLDTPSDAFFRVQKTLEEYFDVDGISISDMYENISGDRISAACLIYDALYPEPEIQVEDANREAVKCVVMEILHNVCAF